MKRILLAASLGATLSCSYPNAKDIHTNGAFDNYPDREVQACTDRGGKPVKFVGSAITVVCFAPEVLR